MEAVKRAKPVQKKIVHNILPVLFANTDAFSIRRVKELTVGEYLSSWLLLWRHFHTSFSAKATRIIRWHTPCDFTSKRRAREYLEIRKQKGGNSS
jgi:hypothetical protein